MNWINAFTPLVGFWLISFGVMVICQLALAVYRTRRLPAPDSVYAMAGACVCLYIAQEMNPPSAVAGWALFMSGGAAYSAGAWSWAAANPNRCPT